MNENRESKNYLMSLVHSGQDTMVENFLNQKPTVDLNQKDGNGQLAIVVAAERNDTATFNVLVKYQANPILTDSSKHDVTFWAKINENKVMLKACEEKQAVLQKK